MTFVRSTVSLAVRSLTGISHRCGAYEKSRTRICNERAKNHCLSRISRINALYSSDCKSARCWQCNSSRESAIFCSKCKALQEPNENLNYFQVIGLQVNYDVESEEMRRKYRELQNILHPDRFGNRSEKEKMISENMSSMINKAYNTLSHPLDRGLYLLELRNSAISEGSSDTNPEFLMEIMESNERVQEAAEDREKIVRLMEENDSILDQLTRQVSEAFGDDDLEKAKLTLIKMKYYTSLQSRLKNHKRELGIVD